MDNLKDLFGLEGKRFLLLGGGQGIGEATVNLLALCGAKIAVADRELERAENVAAAVNKHGGSAIAVSVDVLDDAALAETIVRVDAEFGPLDGLATIIGMAAWSPLIDLKIETWDADHHRNLRYFFIAGREVAKLLLKRGATGSIVCVGSVDGISSSPNHAAYGSAKAGLISLVKSMAVEWSEHGIRANLVAPGGIVTPRIPFRGEAAERSSMSMVPMKRRGKPEEIAKAITFLLSDMASYVTGQALAVDGGFLAANLFHQIPREVPSNGVIGGS